MKRNVVAVAVLIIALVTLAGCASEGYNMQKGAAIGAATGALAGQMIGRDTASTLIGAGAGTLVGAIGGNAVDQHVTNQKRQGQGQTGQAAAYPGGAGSSQDPPGRWVQVPGQWQGGKWVPAHTVWVPVNP
ncbi:MAG: hypothetical protein A4E60_01702 [Syntrophorhabdus sp. PtaB.Bin047]|nr:MAG: hypothetical protein A4E60_01702 [Syntrophorhabdus sp. PtaB.Bin047]